MDFKQEVIDALQEVVPELIRQQVEPLKAEIVILKKQLKPYGDKKSFSIKELAEITSRTRQTVHKDIQDGKLRAFKENENSKSYYIAIEHATSYIQKYSKAHA